MAVRVKTLKLTTVNPGWSVTLTVPVVVKSEMNERCHWAVRHRRFEEQARTVRMLFLVSGLVDICGMNLNRVTLTKLGGKGLDSDNLSGAFKGVRDEVAKIIHIDDGDPRITWTYSQSPGGPQGVRITLESGG